MVRHMHTSEVQELYLQERHPQKLVIALHRIPEVVLQRPKLSVQVVINGNGAEIDILMNSFSIRGAFGVKSKSEVCTRIGNILLQTSEQEHPPPPFLLLPPPCLLPFHLCSGKT